MAKRKVIRAVEALVAETWRGANKLMATEIWQAREKWKKQAPPFVHSAGSTKRYLAWCERNKLDPTLRVNFDLYFGCRDLLDETPSKQVPLCPALLEDLFGPATPKWYGPNDAKEEGEIEESWTIVLTVRDKPTEEHDYRFQRFRKKVTITYSISTFGRPIDKWTLPSWEFSTIRGDRYPLNGRAYINYHPQNNWQSLDSVFKDIMYLHGFDLHDKEKPEKVNVFANRYTYHKPPRKGRWRSKTKAGRRDEE